MGVTAIAERQSSAIDPALVEQVLLKGDLRGLTPAQKVGYYNQVCQSLGLNPLTQPFAYIVLNGKEVLYAKRDAAEQLRKVHSISIDPAGFTREVIEGIYIVTAPASMANGRTDVSTGAVSIEGLKGEARANAMMKAETKAKRRVTLSICGLGMLDETEVESIPNASAPAEPVQASRRIALPAGTVQILSVQVTPWGGDVLVVTADGEEVAHKTTERRCAELCEQIAQEAVPVTLELQPITRGKNAGKVKLVGVHRHRTYNVDDLPDGEVLGTVEGLPITAADIPF